jgi:predicted transcriptional regulator
MQRQVDRIDPVHSRAISDEIAERLRILLSKDRSPLPAHLRQRLDQLREMDEPSPSVVPAMRNETF